LQFQDKSPSASLAAIDLRSGFTGNNNQIKNGQGSPPDSVKVGGMSSRAIVKFSYDPRLEDELKLTRGDTISVIDKSSDGWWKGESNGRTGWFPSNYVEEVVDQHHPSGNGNEGSNGCSVIGRPPVTVIAAPAPSTQNKTVLELVAEK
ncbi:SH3 domain protein, partial [Ancylostoma duodenale]